MDMNRRKFVAAGVIGTAGVIGAGCMRLANAKTDTPTQRPEVKFDSKGKVYHEPLPYVPLDPLAAQDLSYTNKLIGDCMYGVFATIVEMLADKIGGEYLTYPTSVTRMGAGGIVGWGSTCGSLQGAAMAIYLISPNPVPLIDDVFNFYQYTALPDQKPNNAKMDITPSTADSTLCHISISHWTKASGHKAFSKERTERCAHLAAVTTRRTVEVLNAQLQGDFKATNLIPEAVASCRACHDMGGEMENTRGKMDCLGCHSGHDEVKPNIYDRIGTKF